MGDPSPSASPDKKCSTIIELLVQYFSSKLVHFSTTCTCFLQIVFICNGGHNPLLVDFVSLIQSNSKPGMDYIMFILRITTEHPIGTVNQILLPFLSNT